MVAEEVPAFDAREELNIGEVRKTRIVRIFKGTRQDFFEKPSEFEHAHPTDKCIKLELETTDKPEAEEIFEVTYTVSLGPKAHLAKFMKRYGEVKPGLQVTCIRNEAGRLMPYLG